MLKFIRLAFYLMVLFSLPFFIASCNTFDPPLVVPVYGHIDSIHFNVPVDSAYRQGSASANIQYAWVYLDDNPVGAFQMPCTFPMIAANGPHNIKIYPGIIPVGINSPAAIYPFYQFYSFNISLQQGLTYKFFPTSVYNTWSEFPYKEDFEGESIFGSLAHIINYHGGANPTGASTTTMIVTNNPSLTYGRQGKSGMVVVNQSAKYYIGMTWPWDSLPNTSTPVYVELNYRCTADFTIGMFDGDTTNQSSPIAVVYPASKWTKMYVSLNSTIQSPSGFSILYQNVWFSMVLDTADGHTSDTLLLDNIKILY